MSAQVGTAVETVAIQVMTGETLPIIIVTVSTRGTLAEHNMRRLRDYTSSWVGSPLTEIVAANPVLAIIQQCFAAQGLDFEREQHGSVKAAMIASCIHELWGCRVSYQEGASPRE